MRRSKCSAFWLMLLMLLGLAAAAVAEPGDGLEGTSWKFRKKGVIHWLMFWQRDYLVFQDGNFIEAKLAKRGFSPSLYSAAKTANGIEWSAGLQSRDYGQMAWKATRVSYWMNGTYTWTRPGRDDKVARWKAWQIFPKPPKS